MKFVADELVDDAGSVLLQLGIGRIDEGCECSPGSGVVLESVVDFAELVGAHLGKSGAEGSGIAVLGEGEIVKVPGGDFLVAGHAMEELLAEDFSGGLEGQAGATGSIGGTKIVRQTARGCDADVSAAAVEADGGGLSPDGDALDGLRRSEVEGEAASGVPVKVAVGFGLDEEVHVNAVPVRPARGQGGAAAEADVGLAAERAGKGFADGVEEFARTAWKSSRGPRGRSSSAIQTEIRSTMLRVTLFARRS